MFPAVFGDFREITADKIPHEPETFRHDAHFHLFSRTVQHFRKSSDSQLMQSLPFISPAEGISKQKVPFIHKGFEGRHKRFRWTEWLIQHLCPICCATITFTGWRQLSLPVYPVDMVRYRHFNSREWKERNAGAKDQSASGEDIHVNEEWRKDAGNSISESGNIGEIRAKNRERRVESR